MTSPLSKAADEALALYRQYDALARLNARKADDELSKFIDAMTGGSLLNQPPDVLPTSLPRCVRVWTQWLADNGPNTNMHIKDVTGVKFDRARTHTILWDDVAKDIDNDDLVPPNTIIRFKGIVQTEGRGANPVVYALWSQRYDVKPRFGVGPERPGSDEQKADDGALEDPEAADHDVARTCRTCHSSITLDALGNWLVDGYKQTCEDDPDYVHTPEPTTLLGVIHPPEGDGDG